MAHMLDFNKSDSKQEFKMSWLNLHPTIPTYLPQHGLSLCFFSFVLK